MDADNQEQDGDFADLFEDLAERIKEVCSKLPGAEKLKRRMEELREVLFRARPAQLALVGRTGSGKSRLINALLSKRVAVESSVESANSSGWFALTSPAGRLEMLDTRGTGEGVTPAGAAHEEPIGAITEALREKQADALLYVCKAKDIRAYTPADILYLGEVKKIVLENHDYNPPVIAIISQVDELDPPDCPAPFEEDEKKENIRIARDLLRKLLEQGAVEYLDVIPVSALVRYDGQGNIIRDRRWNLGALLELLVIHLPKSAQIEMARIGQIRRVQQKVAERVIKTAALAAAGVAVTPLPLADILPITSIQILMVGAIAKVGGRDLSKQAVAEFFVAIGANVAAAYILRELARALVRIIAPGPGNLVSASMAYVGTNAIGIAATAYFIEGVSADKAKKVYEEAKNLPAPSSF